MPTTSPATLVRQTIKTALDAEFATELPGGFQHDKLDESVGWDGTYGAIYPDAEAQNFLDASVWDVTVIVQLYGAYDKRVDPKQTVDPAGIEGWAERLKRALRAPSHGTSTHMWFFNVTEVAYPDDPTGNKTRLEVTVVANSQNSAVWETTG